MGRRKWKAKKLEKKNRKGQPPQTESTQGIKLPHEHFVSKEVNSISDENDSEDEIATARRAVTQKVKGKKSGGFQSMGLSHAVLKGILRRGYKVPTPIQRKTLPVILEGKDVVAMARTGSGKTAAFLVPMFERLRGHSSQGVRAIIMAPTRELATQTLKFAKEIGKFTGLKAAVVLGGDRMDDQFAALHDNPDIIIATPGRFLHVLVEMEMKLKTVEYIVFDEADRLFEMGFADQLQEIITRLPDSRQTLLFSATLPRSLVEFARAGLTDPVLIRLDVDAKLSENLGMSFLSCRDSDKCALLLYLLKHVIKETEQTVVFAATKHHVEFLYMLLTACGLSVTYIYSALDQTARKINAARFSLGKVKVLLVTDLAARGIDVPLLDNVINFHFPAKPKLFVHRVGRVARAGRTGVAYSLVSPDEMAHLVDLHLFLGRPVKLVPLVGDLQGDEDGCLGEVPQSILDDEEADLIQVIQESVDLTSMIKVCRNAFNKYSRSRPAPAPESVKRVKKMIEDGIKLGIHPMFKSIETDEQGVRLQMLNALKQYKPKTTIFEINSTNKKAGLAVMKAKREQHEAILINNDARRKEREAAMEDSSTSSFSAPVIPSSSSSQSQNKKKKGHQEEAAENDIEAVFGEIVSAKPSQRKKKATSDFTVQKEVKDKENFIQYRPSDFASERGLSIHGNFEREAASAVLDFTNVDDEPENKKKRKWDRKRKRYVTESTEDPIIVPIEILQTKTKVLNQRTYQDWKTRTKFAEQDKFYKDDDDDSGDDKRGGGSKRKSKSQNASTGGGKFTVAGMRNRRWHTRGMDNPSDGQSSKQKFKRGGRPGMGLKSSDQILKSRRQKAKVQNFQKFREGVRAKRKAKEGSGGGNKRRQKGGKKR
ncbi:ATP-dependent RNA helicase DDX54-like [Elysia marginata]|uniref:RNA helicase n=1 Tax=Elysia marginata TaxID=1093978 RepID=A0AAV4I884_9GAST|nr:ATP-dependent RNA helicase DDX54-like [Elysia marginata]